MVEFPGWPCYEPLFAVKLTITLFPSNPLAGLCALSINHSNSYLAYPGSATIGEIIVYDANSLVREQVIIIYIILSVPHSLSYCSLTF